MLYQKSNKKNIYKIYLHGHNRNDLPQ